MVLPNFLIAGAMKAGTSWLVYNLRMHPQIFLPSQELHFFNDAENFDKGIDWYERQFNGVQDEIAIGEKTAGYMLWESCSETIYKHMPDVKVLMVIRDPIKRAISQINHHIRYADIPYSILDSSSIVDTKDFAEIDKKFAILDRGRYFNQVKRFYETFGEDRVLVVVNEDDIRLKPQETLKQVCKFLEVDDSFEFKSKMDKVHVNTNSELGVLLANWLPFMKAPILKVDRLIPGSKVKPFRLSQHDSAQLRSKYTEDSRNLFALLGRDMPSSWLS